MPDDVVGEDRRYGRKYKQTDLYSALQAVHSVENNLCSRVWMSPTQHIYTSQQVYSTIPWKDGRTHGMMYAFCTSPSRQP
jgi:hypothetical protein